MTCTGLQPQSSVFVFGPGVQFDTAGSPIPEKEQEYVWVDEILKKLGQVVNPLASIPQASHALKKIVKGVHKICRENVMSGIHLLGELL